jgi:hypothetical protein
MGGKCPGCKRWLVSVHASRIDVHADTGRTYDGVQYVCSFPDCQTVISVQIDPVLIANDTIKAVVKKLSPNA